MHLQTHTLNVYALDAAFLIFNTSKLIKCFLLKFTIDINSMVIVSQGTPVAIINLKKKQLCNDNF